MNEIFLSAQTPTCHVQYSMHIVDTTALSLEKYQDSSKLNDCCKSGCQNYGRKWSCPPFAPQYEDFVRNYKNIKVILLKAELSQFSYIKNDYLKIKAANTILKSRIDKTLRYFKNLDTNYISTGSCRLCKKCKRKENLPCAHPELMSYSFESLGINVCKLTEELFDTELLWYSKYNLPLYTCVVAGLLSNNEFSSEKIVDVIKEYH